MKESTSKNTCYLLAGILLLIPISLARVSAIVSSITIQYWNFFLLVSYIPPIVLGIFLLLKKGNWATTICLGLMALHNLYIGINYLYLQNELFAPDFSSYYVGLAVASFFSALAYGFLTVLSFFSHQKGGARVKKLWFIPAVLMLGYLIAPIVGYLLNDTLTIGFGFLGFTGQMILLPLLYVSFMICAGLAFKSTCPEDEEVPDGSKQKQEGYYDLVQHALLLLFTFGIWELIWIYRTTKFLNNAPDQEERNPTTKLLLCMFVPFYYVYWIYRSCKILDAWGKEKQNDEEITLIAFILSFFVRIVSLILMQNKINRLCTMEKKGAPDSDTEGGDRAPQAKNDGDRTEEIRNYKALLDDGIITEEEFEAKKKQLLGL